MEVMSSCGEITTTALILPEGLSFEEWQAAGEPLQKVERSVRWWIGDWLNYGERVYGETYAQAVESTGRKIHDLQNMAYVASRIEPSRRREELSWTAHAAIASLEPEEQQDWLARAVDEQWSSQDLRREVRQMRGEITRADASATCRKCGEPCESCSNGGDPSRDLVERFGRGRVVDGILAWANEPVDHHAMSVEEFAARLANRRNRSAETGP